MIRMEIIVESEKEERMVFTNEGINNSNFIDMYVGDKEYMIAISDLEAVVEVFKKEKENSLK